MARVRTLTVCNFVTVDGRYEDDDHDIISFGIEKIVVSDTITEADLEPYDNVRMGGIWQRADALARRSGRTAARRVRGGAE